MRTRTEAVVDRCFQTVPKALFGPLAAGGVLAVAAKLDLVARLLAVIAAVLPVRAVRLHHALTQRNSSRPFMSRVMDAGSAWLTLST